MAPRQEDTLIILSIIWILLPIPFSFSLQKVIVVSWGCVWLYDWAHVCRCLRHWFTWELLHVTECHRTAHSLCQEQGCCSSFQPQGCSYLEVKSASSPHNIVPLQHPKSILMPKCSGRPTHLPLRDGIWAVCEEFLFPSRKEIMFFTRTQLEMNEMEMGWRHCTVWWKINTDQQDSASIDTWFMSQRHICKEPDSITPVTNGHILSLNLH